MKKGGHTPDRYLQGATFSFYNFFSFMVRKSSKMAEMCQKIAEIYKKNVKK